MRRTSLTFGLVLMAIAIAGCETGPMAAERARPAGVPANAALVGGGLPQQLRFHRDGRLIVVDTETNAAIATLQVQADEAVKTDMESLMVSLFLARHGSQGIAMVREMMREDGTSTDTDAMSSESMTLELYFIPVDGEQVASD